ncbi:MAG: hypothetical protein R3F56_17920 [Planctomycetota bacterium]
MPVPALMTSCSVRSKSVRASAWPSAASPSAEAERERGPRRIPCLSSASGVVRLRTFGKTLPRAPMCRYKGHPMLITRKIGKILRGKATRTQVVLAATLGGMLGFVPGFFLPGDLGGGFMQAPGTILGLMFLVLVLNANLGVFGLATLLGKLLSLPTLSVSFAVGRLLLDGPLEGLFRILVNAPVIAWCGLEHYATTGGLVVGLVFGLVFGFALWRGVQGFRTKMAALEHDSDRYQRWAGKKSTRFLAWLLLGGDKRGKLSYQDLASRQKQGLPVRVVGLVVVLVLAVGLWLSQRTLAGPLAKTALRSTLETLNGATTDIAGVQLDLTGGRLQVDGLAMADPERLERDNLRAQVLEFDLGTGDILRKRFVVERLGSTSASHGLPRQTPGERVGKEPPPPPPPPPGEGKTLEDYIKTAQVWKARLQQVQGWLQRLRTSGSGQETKEEREVRVAREKLDDVTKVRALHLLQQAPAVLVKHLVFDGVRVAGMDDDTFDVTADNLSSNPALLSAPVQLAVTSKSGRYEFRCQLQGDAVHFKLGLVGLDADAVGEQLAVSGQAPIRGGKLDALLDGSLGLGADGGFTIDLPLRVTLHGTTLSLFGLQPTAVDELTIPLGIRGPLTNPRISLDDKKLADALVSAGRKELADQVRTRAARLLEGLPMPGGGAAVGEAVGDLLEGKKTPQQLAEEAKAAAEAEAKKRAEEELAKQKAELQKKAEEELKKRGLGGLNELFGGKKKDG